VLLAKKGGESLRAPEGRIFQGWGAVVTAIFLDNFDPYSPPPDLRNLIKHRSRAARAAGRSGGISFGFFSED